MNALNVIWLAGVVLAWWPMSQWVLQEVAPEVAPDDPHPVDRAGSVFFGGFISCLWPAVLAGYLVWRVSRALWTRVLDGDREKVGS